MSKHSEFNTPATELEATKRCLHVVEDTVRTMQEQVQSQGPPLQGVEAAGVSAEMARVAVKRNGQSLTESESALWSEVTQLALCVGELGGKVPRKEQESDYRGWVYLQCDGLQASLNAMASQHSRVRSLWNAVRE